MRGVVVILTWSVLAAAVGWLAWAPEIGAFAAGPWSTLGVGLIGAAICVEARRRQLEDQQANE